MTLLLFVVVMFTLKSVAIFGQEIARGHIVAWLSENLRKYFADLYSNMKYSFYVSTEVGYFNNIITTEINGAIGGLKKYTEVIVGICNMLVYVSIAFFINYESTIFILVCAGILQISYRAIRAKVSNISYRLTRSNAVIQNIFLQFIYNYKYLKATANILVVAHKLHKELRNNRILQFRKIAFNGFTTASFDVFKTIILCVIIYYLVAIKSQEIATVLVPFILLNKSLSLLFAVQTGWQRFYSATGSVVMLEEAKSLLQNNAEKLSGTTVAHLNTDITLQNIYLAYGNMEVLKGVSIAIPRHQCIGIVGVSGSGKTSLLDLITAILPPTAGRVCLDGVDYSELDHNSLRELFGYITQDSVMFNDTVANNITLWDADIGHTDYKARLEQAARLADCMGFINAMPRGFDTLVGDKGIKLSGGQRQRIAIAREIFRDAKILIFDEATASLDSASERYIQASIEKLLGQKTMIIVAHRLSTMKICDTIYVLEEGKIVEQGTWNELLAHDNSRFAIMCKTQGVRLLS